MDDEFSSSDIEFDVPPQPFPRAGQKLMKVMIENKDRDRLETDERLRILDEIGEHLGILVELRVWLLCDFYGRSVSRITAIRITSGRLSGLLSPHCLPQQC